MQHTLDDLQDLTPVQRALLARLEREERFTEHFYFTGGTLLKALGIVPRESNDLDFFTFPEVDSRQFRLSWVSMREAIVDVLGRDSFDETDRGFVLREQGMFVDCIYEMTPLIDKPAAFGALRTAGIRDIGASKAGALCSRDELKDYIDIAFLTKREHWLLADLERLAEEKYRMGTITEEKLLEELLHKRELFVVTSDRFIRNGKENVHLVHDQVDFLLQSTSL
ncbi:MAG: nucleotidyl transferase AbiEii/AbiGii toxin family protein [Patescibacteria group bacterium]